LGARQPSSFSTAHPSDGAFRSRSARTSSAAAPKRPSLSTPNRSRADTTGDGAAIFAEALRILVERDPIRHAHDVIPVTISLGVSVAVVTHPQTYNSVDMIRRADEKLYEAKRSGRNRVIL
jgi:GGDEF domain-containing protein